MEQTEQVNTYLHFDADLIEKASSLKDADKEKKDTFRKELQELFKKKGYRFYLESPTNQQFFILENKKMETLQKKVAFSFWEKYDEGHTVIRIATSWATKMEDVEELCKIL